MGITTAYRVRGVTIGNGQYAASFDMSTLSYRLQRFISNDRGPSDMAGLFDWVQGIMRTK